MAELKKNYLKPHKSEYWCIPKKHDAEFVACMEDILDVYEMPYQLLGEAREPLPARCGDTEKKDYEYVRNGTCSIFAFIELLGGKHHVSAREHRTAVDWAEEIKYLVDVMYPDVEKIILVMDNLNTHVKGSLYKKISSRRSSTYSKKT